MRSMPGFNLGAIPYCLLTIVVLCISCIMLTDSNDRKGVFELFGFDLNGQLLQRGLPGPLGSIPGKATQIEGTIAAQASSIKTAAPQFVKSAIAAGETMISSHIPTGTSVGVLDACLDFQKNSQCVAFPLLTVTIIFSVIFMVLSTSCYVWSLGFDLFTLIMPLLGLTSWMFSLSSLCISVGILDAARQLQHRLGGELRQGFAVAGTIVNFVSITVHFGFSLYRSGVLFRKYVSL